MTGKLRFNIKSKDLRRRAKSLGYSVGFAGSGHLKFTHPSLSEPVYTSTTPGSQLARYRDIKRLEKALKP